MTVRLILTDVDQGIQAAWKSQFERWPAVEVRGEDVLETRSHAFLLPGNSFGFLDSGLELKVLEQQGWELEEELRGRIRREHDGEILVGQAIVLRPAGRDRAIVYAPVWRTPRKLNATVNVYLAVRAAFLALRNAPAIESLAVPSLGVDAGLDPRVSARQIRYAYEIANGLRGAGDKNLTQILRRERKLQSIPGEGEQQ
jgi:O-acetyl-ADP-ribose deacetylase (regulator of RNase III)